MKVLKIDSTILHLKIALFIVGFFGIVVSTYFLYFGNSTILIFNLVLASFFIPWSFFLGLGEWDKHRKQFQKMTIEDEYLLFEHLPLQGGHSVCAQIDFKNIESIQIKFTGIHVLFVRRYEWEGEACDFITPSGYVPKLQIFSLSLNTRKRREILSLLESKGIELKGKR